MSIILTGRIDITDNLQFVMETIHSQNPSVVVINLDEDNQQLKQCQNVLGGVELLPSPSAIACEIDGDEASYDYFYSMHFTDPFVVQYVTAIIAALRIGKNILMYYPTLDPSETKTVPKLIDQFWKNFGIGIGLLGYNIGVIDGTKSDLWARLLYTARVIPVEEFLSEYTLGAPVDDPIMELLLSDIKPFAATFQEGIDFVMRYWAHLKEKPGLQIPFHSV